MPALTHTTPKIICPGLRLHSPWLRLRGARFIPEYKGLMMRNKVDK